MKAGTKWYVALSAFGIVMVSAAQFFLADFLNDAQSGAIIGVGAGLFGYGIAKWLLGCWGKKNPDLMKQTEIEAKDERNQMIRNKAQAISGEWLHWLLMAGAWTAIFMNVPLWVTLAFVSVFLLKTIFDLILTAYYQRKM